MESPKKGRHTAMKTKNPDPAALHVPSKWYRHYTRLQTLRTSLLEDSAEQAAKIAEPLEPHSMDMADSASDEFDHNLALGILAHEQDALFEVDAAIQRILDGTYGICEKTGKAIPEARLKIVPWTRYRKEALERLERRHMVEHTHLGAVSSIQGPAPGGLAHAPDSEQDEPITREVARRKRQNGIRNLAGDANLNLTPPESLET